jgi:hypothetical protein
MTRQRNWAIWILIIVAVVAGILAVIDALRYMGWLPALSLGSLNFFLPNAYWLGAGLSVLVAVIWFAVAAQLYNLNPRGWLFVVVIAVFNLIMLALALLGQTAWTAISLAVIVNVIALILALLPSTKNEFGRL